jgi:hypothetical protein
VVKNQRNTQRSDSRFDLSSPSAGCDSALPDSGIAAPNNRLAFEPRSLPDGLAAELDEEARTQESLKITEEGNASRLGKRY